MPTIVQFSATLLLSALMRAPWDSYTLLLPMAGYAMLAIAPAMVPAHFLKGLFNWAAAVLVLLFTGIHNARDAAAHHGRVR